MGKILIIKGADFSANGILSQTTWYVNEYDYTIAQGVTPTTTAVSTSVGFKPNYDFGGKIINTLKFIPASAGKISLLIGDGVTDESPILATEISISSSEVGTPITKFFDDINIPIGKTLWIGKGTDTATFIYANYSDTHSQEDFSPFGGFWLNCGKSNASKQPNVECLAINWGYTD